MLDVYPAMTQNTFYVALFFSFFNHIKMSATHDKRVGHKCKAAKIVLARRVT